MTYQVILDYLRHQAYLTKETKTLIVDERHSQRECFTLRAGSSLTFVI